VSSRFPDILLPPVSERDAALAALGTAMIEFKGGSLHLADEAEMLRISCNILCGATAAAVDQRSTAVAARREQRNRISSCKKRPRLLELAIKEAEAKRALLVVLKSAVRMELPAPNFLGSARVLLPKLELPAVPAAIEGIDPTIAYPTDNQI
jgi:hypothetical protein